MSAEAVDGIADALDELEDPGYIDEPEEGERFIAVELTIANTGDQTYDAPDNSGTLVDDQRRGCLVFELAEDRGLRLFQFTPDSAFGPDTGEWQL